MKEKKAIIIGAGVTGLTTAFYLKKDGWQIQILEQKQRTGGSICTHHEKGFVFESGPNTGIISQPEVIDLISQLGNKINIEPLGENINRRLVWKNCRWHSLPHCLSDSLHTPLFKWNEKLKLLIGTLLNHRYIHNNHRIQNKLKPENITDPFIEAIYSGNSQGLLTNTDIFIRKQKKEVVSSKCNLKKTTFQNNKRNSIVDRQLFFITDGLGCFTEAMSKTIGEENICLGVSNINVYPKGEVFSVNYTHNNQQINTEAPVVISTIGAADIGKTFPFLNEHEKNTISNMPHINLVQIVIGYNTWNGIPLKALGGIIPVNENRNTLGMLFPSSFLKGRAPEKGALINLFMGGIKNPDIINMSDEVIKQMAIDELRCMLLISDKEPDLFRIFRHNNAFPLYNDTLQCRAEMISKIENQFPGLFLAGNIRDGIGMDHRIKQGTCISLKLIEQYR